MTIEELEDERAIRSVVMRYAHCIDRRRWADLRAIFADVLRTDYTSLSGGAPQETPADTLVAAWERRLTRLDATQHLLGPAEVELAGDQATARCHVRAYHLFRDAPSGAEWMIAGHYTFGLVRAEEGFRVRSITLETLYQTGNPALLTEARR